MILIIIYIVAAASQAAVIENVNCIAIQTMDVIPDNFVNILKQAVRSRKLLQARIVGGEESTPGQFPYQIALRVIIPGNSLLCGGSILNKEWILTAAHCVDRAASVEILIGAHNIFYNDGEQFQISTTRFIIHENWDPFTLRNDIALLQLSQSLRFTARVQPIRLPRRFQIGNSFANENAIVSGWGRISDTPDTESPVLRWAQSFILSNKDCMRWWRRMLSNHQICLSNDGTPRTSCQGDSGGPLVITESNGDYTQIGIVSFVSTGGCASGWPSVYTRVTSYLDWIETNTGGSVIIRN